MEEEEGVDSAGLGLTFQWGVSEETAPCGT